VAAVNRKLFSAEVPGVTDVYGAEVYEADDWTLLTYKSTYVYGSDVYGADD
jgi:hypothetical protein